jgi:predicted transcriptional regulator
LLQELKILKQASLLHINSSDKTAESFQLDRTKIEKAVDGSINDSDWKILNALFDNPNTTNREIADQISLSIEGVKSSLKKMYMLFEITHSRENKRLGLTMKVTHISNDNLEPI